jgi:hypothetical protein
MVVDNVHLGSSGFHPSIKILGHELSEFFSFRGPVWADKKRSTSPFLPLSWLPLVLS